MKRGPQQEFGDVELEDTYDALNDETFGIINEGIYLRLLFNCHILVNIKI